MEGVLLINLDGTYQLFIKDTNLNIWKPAGPADIDYFKFDISEKLSIFVEYITINTMKNILYLSILL